MNNFSKQICAWYQINKRDLPWRNTQDPYRIWLSEIILQQTRVAQGLSYYKRFVKEFPTVTNLARADSEKIMKLWQGLGYYSRARNLHQTAKYIVEHCHGRFPDSYQELKKLKGVGDYTAAAIASFAYNLPHAVIDGNVYRVLARIWGIDIPIDSAAGKKIFMEKAATLLDKKNPSLYNQAIMEFGALQCVPQNPACSHCIFKNRCVAFQTGIVNFLPVKQHKTIIKNYWYYYIVLKYKNKYFLKKRSSQSIWKGLYDFLLIESDKKITKKKLIETIKNKQLLNLSAKLVHVSDVYSHILTHRKINAVFYLFELPDIKNCPGNMVAQNWKKPPELAVPRLIEKYLTDIFAVL
jgi:A/G-specific adenine glycosylase